MEKLGCPVREVAALRFPAPGRSPAVTTSALGALVASRGQLGLGGTGSEGRGHRGMPHTAIPRKSMKTTDSVLVWAQPYLPRETLGRALSFPGPQFLHLRSGGNDCCPADILK